MATQRGRGKPKRYEGEDSTRLSVLIRPRYREALEIIARDRQTTLSEAMEYCIAKISMSYEIDGKSVLSMIFPESELTEINKLFKLNKFLNDIDINTSLLLLVDAYKAYKASSGLDEFKENFPDDLYNAPVYTFVDRLIESFESLKNSPYMKVKALPESLRSPIEKYQFEVTNNLKDICPVRTLGVIWDTIGEFFKIGMSADSVSKLIRSQNAKVDHQKMIKNFNLETFLTFVESSLDIDKSLEILHVLKSANSNDDDLPK